MAHVPPIEDFVGALYDMTNGQNPPAYFKMAKWCVHGLKQAQYNSPMAVPKWVVCVCQVCFHTASSPDDYANTAREVVHKLAGWEPQARTRYAAPYGREHIARACLTVTYPEELTRMERIALFLDAVMAAEKLGGWEAAFSLLDLQARG